MKGFEDSISDILTDMVGYALDYCNKSVDDIYIHCSNENNCISSNVFFKKNGNKLKRNQIKNQEPSQQQELIHYINKKIKDIENVCIDHKQPIPTEIKLFYEVSSKNLKSDFSYENLYSDSDTVVVQDVFDMWFEAV